MAEDKDKLEEDVEESPENTPESNSDEEDSIIPDEILESIPKEDRQMISRSLSIMGGMDMTSPIAKKITPEHIGVLINNSEKQDVRDSNDRNWKRGYHLVIMIFALGFVSFLVYLFKDNQAVLVPLITGILAFLGGLGVGKSL